MQELGEGLKVLKGMVTPQEDQQSQQRATLHLRHTGAVSYRHLALSTGPVDTDRGCVVFKSSFPTFSRLGLYSWATGG